jgi:hypothetical protein
MIQKELATIFTLMLHVDGPIRGKAVVRLVPGGECACPMEASSGPHHQIGPLAGGAHLHDSERLCYDEKLAEFRQQANGQALSGSGETCEG